MYILRLNAGSTWLDGKLNTEIHGKVKISNLSKIYVQGKVERPWRKTG